MKMIGLTRGKVTIVDDDVYEWASKFKWHAVTHTHFSTFYAVRNSLPNLKTRKRILIYLHREILQPDKKQQTDHKNGDGLDNRRENLRVVTSRQNRMAYQPPKEDTSSRFRGVHKRADCGKWRARITLAKKKISLGNFDCEEDAARAYDTGAKKLFGEFAQLNFPAHA